MHHIFRRLLQINLANKTLTRSLFVAFNIVCGSLFCAESELNIQFDIINVIWGRNYTDTFLKTTLPLQLCPGNLGCLPSGSARYRIFTPRADWEYMQSHPNMKKLQEMIPVDFVEITPPNKDSGPYSKMTECHNQALVDARENEAALIFIAPDILLSNQTFRTILKGVKEGKRAIMVMPISLQKETMSPLLESLLEDKQIAYNGLDSRSLVKLSLPHLHPLSESFFCDTKLINDRCSQIFWHLDSENLLTRAFCLPTILLRPELQILMTPSHGHTVDNFTLSMICPSEDKWLIIQDSDDMCLFELSNINHSKSFFSLMPNNISTFVAYFEKATNPQCLFLVQKPIYIHSTDYKQEWKKTEMASETFIEEVLSRSAFSLPFLVP